MSNKISVFTYFDPEMVEWMDRYVLKRKQSGDRQYSRNRLINEAVRRMKEEVEGMVNEDAFARELGYADWDRLMAVSEHVVSNGDVDWWITRLPNGKWAAWDDAELAADRVECFDTREEAIRFHRSGFEAAELPPECWLLGGDI